MKRSGIAKRALCAALAALFLVAAFSGCGSKFNEAASLLDAGKYDEAIDAFLALNSVEGTAKAGEIYSSEGYRAYLKTKEIGDTLRFGAYEQDNDASDGKEAIEWIVLEKDGDTLLLITKYVLDNKPFFGETWEDCNLRKWLNGNFLNEAFGEEKKMILTSAVAAEKNPTYETATGSDTEDKIYILSYSEANDKYFHSNDERCSAPTPYAEAQGAEKPVGTNAFWWLRTPGKEAGYAVYVTFGGAVDDFGIPNMRTYCGDRPVMRIDLK